MTDLVKPNPTLAWVFVDEHPDSINDGCFFNNPHALGGASRWTDLPASYHNGGCGFSFADGHSEIRKWKESSTFYPITKKDFPGLACANSRDYYWVAERTPKAP
jgi:prepilin-type processing-associated H-X9-DG protein